MLKQLLLALAVIPGISNAQTFDFDLTKPQPVYTDSLGYGYDVVEAPNLKAKKSHAPFFFSVRVPDGNYRVRVVLGSRSFTGNTTVRAENRRLMVENAVTPRRATQTYEFVVSKRTPDIDGTRRVKIKDRERDYFTWDDKLTLEFNGDAPAVTSIHIEPADVPTIYLCGNSTVVDQSHEPWASWGQMITRWFGPGVCISNHAESGLTARTFLASFRLEKILQTLKAGDWVVCEFGHNDEKEKRPGDGAWYHYQYQLKIFIDQVRAKGGNLIFCTPTQRRAFGSDGRLTNTHGDFPAAMRQVAEREGVPVIDLNEMTRVLFETMGNEGSKRLLVHYPANTFPGQTAELADNTHFNPFGAYEVAKCVVMGMKQIGFPLLSELRREWTDFSPAQPDDWQTFKWAPAPVVELTKPDGN